MKSTKKELKKLLENNDNKLEIFVINDILDQDQPNEYIDFILTHGCINGTVSSLIYYKDTKKFFIQFFEEIHDILDDIKQETGDEFSPKNYPRYNDLTWLGYEYTLQKIANKINL